jgi:hypothetical protein
MKAFEKTRREFATSGHAQHGLSLSAETLKALHKRGIYCVPGISLEHQHLAQRYVLRGVESGGAVSDLGRACAFVAEDGSPLPWLQPIHSIAVNGRHAIFLAERLVRLEMLRSGRTFELAITLHTLSGVPDGRRPQIISKLLFRGRDGVLSVDLWKEEFRELRGNLTPVFYDRAGEVFPLPRQLEEAIRKVTAATSCVGCKHVHVGVPPLNKSKGQDHVTHLDQTLVTVGEPKWIPLEMTVPACELDDFMYMGRAGGIELYKHRLTRRYLNISSDGGKFYRRRDGAYIEITKAEALEYVRH